MWVSRVRWKKKGRKKKKTKRLSGFRGVFSRSESSPHLHKIPRRDETHIRRPGGESTGDNKTYPLRKLQSIQKSAPKGRGRRRRRIS
jgi:hypothetical protein